MTEAQNPAPSEQGTATPEQPLQTEQAQQGVPAENTQETPPPQYVTKDDLAQFGNQLAKQLKQSARDRDNRIEQEVNNLKDLVGKSGIQITPQQEATLRTQVAERLETEEAPPDAQVNQPGSAELQLNQIVNESLEPFNVTLNPNSPHFADLQKAITANWNNPNPAAVNKAIIEYGKKEAERIASQKQNADARAIGNGGGLADTSADLPATELWKGAYKR